MFNCLWRKLSIVWGGVCSTARTDLHVFPTSTVYVIDILKQYVVPFAQFHSPA
jgi:hypothetical protein